MSDVYSDVREFHLLAGQPVDRQIDVLDQSERTQLLRLANILRAMKAELREAGDGNSWVALALIVEELSELFDAIRQGNIADTADAVTDLMYVVIGASVRFGLPMGDLWEEVQASNMSKFPICDRCGGSGKVTGPLGEVLDLAEDDPETRVISEHACPKCQGRGRYAILENGKVQKPDSWQPPDIQGCLERAGKVKPTEEA